MKPNVVPSYFRYIQLLATAPSIFLIIYLTYLFFNNGISGKQAVLNQFISIRSTFYIVYIILFLSLGSVTIYAWNTKKDRMRFVSGFFSFTLLMGLVLTTFSYAIALGLFNLLGNFIK